MDLFRKLNREQRLTIVLVTHEQDIAEYAGRRVSFKDGNIVSDEQMNISWDRPVSGV
jgi:putative ABC transport system ATP-binding protein